MEFKKLEFEQNKESFAKDTQQKQRYEKKGMNFPAVGEEVKLESIR